MRRKKTVLFFTVLIIGVVLFLAFYKSGGENKLHSADAGRKLLNESDVVSVIVESINDVVYFTGDLSPKTQTIISSEVDAKVLKVLVDEGQIVKGGQVLAELDTLDLAQAVMQQEAQVAAARAKYDLDLQKMQKQEELYKQGFVSKIAYEELITNYKASLQNYKAQEALLIRNKKQLANTHVTAPFAGVVYQKSIQPGQLALKNTRLFSMANLNDMEIKAAIPSEYVNKVLAGQSVLFKVENDSRTFNGIVARVNQVAQSGTRSYLVYINFPNNKYHLKAGQFIRGQIVLRSLNMQPLIPCDAIRKRGESSFILALDKGVVVARPVSEVLHNPILNRCAVSGVDKGERILSGNILSVKIGDRVEVLN